MWLHHHRDLSIGTFLIAVPLLLASCSNASESEVTIEPPSLQTQTLAEGSDIDSIDTTRAAADSNTATPAPTHLSVSNVRAGYVSLQWVPSHGDTIHKLPGTDSVSYYRVLRNGELFVDAFSPEIEDTNPPAGQVTYAVQAVQFETNPEFSVSSSDFIEIKLVVPTVESERMQLQGLSIDEAASNAVLANLKSCSTAFEQHDEGAFCVNHLGHAWSVNASGEQGDLLPLTHSVGFGLHVSVDNRDAQFGPVPGIPEWTVTNLATGEAVQRELTLAAALSDERYLVNGVAVSENNSVFISGTLYQSYIPRSLGPSPGVLPVTSAYYVAQLDSTSGELIQFKRFPLSIAPGAIDSISNGVLQMFSTGLVTYVDANSLTISETMLVSGTPYVASDSFVYTKSSDDETTVAFYRFAR